MTDALWNGFIGAGGTAICCLVYIVVKHATKSLAKRGISETKLNDKDKQNNKESNLVFQEKPKINLIKGLKSKSLFTRTNIRAFGFIILAIGCIISAESISGYRPFIHISSELITNDEYYQNVSSNLSSISSEISYLYEMLREGIMYFFYITAGTFGLIGVTSFKFK